MNNSSQSEEEKEEEEEERGTVKVSSRNVFSKVTVKSK